VITRSVGISMNKFVEAIRRLLLIITWLPTTIFVGYILLNFNEVADAFYDDIPIFAGFIIVPLVVQGQLSPARSCRILALRRLIKSSG